VKLLELGIVQQERIELVLVDLRSISQIFSIEDIVVVFQRPAIVVRPLLPGVTVEQKDARTVTKASVFNSPI
jgi:hypothetical protein